MVIGFLVWINLRRRVKRYVCLIPVRTYTNGSCAASFSVIDPPSWSDVDDSLRSMSDSEKDKYGIPCDKDSSPLGVDEGADS